MVVHLRQALQPEKNMAKVAMGMHFQSQVNLPSYAGMPSDCSSLQMFCFFDILANCF